MNEDNKILTETVVVQPSATTQKPLSVYDTHIKENFHIFGAASILYGLVNVNIKMFKKWKIKMYILFHSIL